MESPEPFSPGHSLSTDSQVSQRNPINSVHEWLIFIVRLLSRILVFKGRGQEAIWDSSNKPVFWDSEVGHPWKNPTKNPKDTNAILMTKLQVLQGHLRQEGRFPQDVEDEMKLWENGMYNELFFLTSVKSWRWKAMKLYEEILSASKRAERKNVTEPVIQDMLRDTYKWLNSASKLIQDIRDEDTDCNRRRSEDWPNSHEGPEIIDETQKKAEDEDTAQPFLPKCSERQEDINTTGARKRGRKSKGAISETPLPKRSKLEALPTAVNPQEGETQASCPAHVRLPSPAATDSDPLSFATETQIDTHFKHREFINLLEDPYKYLLSCSLTLLEEDHENNNDLASI